MQIARQMGLTNATLGKWRRRFLEQDVSSFHAQEPSLAIRRDNHLVFRRPGSGKNERQTDGNGQNPNDQD
jgi:transposase-like protein